MNQVFLFLIALPLGLYLLALLFQTFEMDANKPTEPTALRETEVDSDAITFQHTTTTVDATEPSAPAIIESQREIATPIETAPALDQGSAAFVVESKDASVAMESEPAPANIVTASIAAADFTAETVAEKESAKVLPNALSDSESNIQLGETATQAVESPTQERVAENAPLTETLVTDLNSESIESDEPDTLLPEGPLELPEKGSPKFAFDYRGRLWIEKRNKGFFRQLRRPQLPPDEPPDKSSRG